MKLQKDSKGKYYAKHLKEVERFKRCGTNCQLLSLLFKNENDNKVLHGFCNNEHYSFKKQRLSWGKFKRNHKRKQIT
jgi:hypothetical protein